MRRTSRWLTVTAVGVSTLLVPALTTATTAAAAPSRAASGAETSTELSQKLADVAAALGEDSPQYGAAAEAVSSGQDVAVDALTTETNELVAHPDGTFELQAHRDAVRTKINGVWEPIDTELVTNPDGTISPKAITLPVTFAGGTGDGPIATAGEGDESLAFTLDGPLPEPVIDGNQVTYPNVRPGVDMVFSVNPTGFTDALVVKTPTAAEALAADPVVFTGTSEGLDLSTSPDGSIIAADASGETALVSPPPIAWDSSGGGEGVNEPTAESVGTGDLHELPAPDITEPEATPESSMTIEVAPPASALNDPDVVYPLYLDPQTGRQRNRWRTVQTGSWNYGPNSTDVMRVGYCDWAGCNDSLQENARSYFEFDLSPLTDGDSSDPTVFDARVQATQVWSASSSAEPVHLRKSGPFSNTETYPGPSGAFLQERSSAAGRDPNPSATLTFDNDAVDTYVEQEAAAEHSMIRFALAAPSENNKYYWKKFGNDTQITVVFGYAPRIPVYKSTNTVTCDNTTYVPAPGDLKVQIEGQPVYGEPAMSFAAYAYNTDTGPFDSSTLAKTTGGWDYNGVNRTWNGVIPALPNGQFAWRAAVQTETNINDPAGNPYPNIVKNTDPSVRPFTVDKNAPESTKIESPDYPTDWWGPSTTNPGTFEIKMPTGADAIAYAFNKPVPTLPNTTCWPAITPDTGYKLRSAARADGYVELTPTSGLRPGVPNTLSVRAFDKAHNVTAEVTHTFYVAPIVPGTTTPARLEAEGDAVSPNQDPSLPQATVTDNVPGAGGSGQYLTLDASDNTSYVDLSFTVNEPGYYALGTRLQTCSTCGDAQFSVPDDTHGPTPEVSTVSTTTGSKFVGIGGYELTAGSNKLRVKFPKASATSPQTVSIDSLHLVRLHAGQYDNLQAAFNNDGIATTGSTGGLFEHDPGLVNTPMSKKALSDDKLASSYNITFTPGVTTTFQIPAATTSGDNVIAAGQQIKVDTNTGVDHVDFLVAATCGAVPKNAKIQFTLTHQPPRDPEHPEQEVPTVSTTSMLPAVIPDWEDAVSADANLKAITMDGSLQGNPATARAGNVNLYAMEIDVDGANRDYPLVEVTLPRTTTTMTQTCADGPQLHVLAMTTR